MKKLIILSTFFSICISNLSAQTSTTATSNTNTLELLGGLSAGFVYNTYIVIGSIADAHTGKIYADEKTEALLKEQESFIQSINNMVDSTIKSGEIESPNDLEFLEQVNATLSGLILQARYYKEEVQNKDGKGRKKYSDQRTANWIRISGLLGLEE